jgi:hypothetical protein
MPVGNRARIPVTALSTESGQPPAAMKPEHERPEAADSEPFATR